MKGGHGMQAPGQAQHQEQGAVLLARYSHRCGVVWVMAGRAGQDGSAPTGR